MVVGLVGQPKTIIPNFTVVFEELIKCEKLMMSTTDTKWWE